jgi:aminoacrylate hydrolase
MGSVIPIEGGTLAYEAAGAGPPIVFIAGLGGHGAYWKAQVQAFSPDFQTVTFDHRGVGSSSGAPPYSIEQWAGDTLRLMDHLNIERVQLVGHSTGGAIAQVVAAGHPDRIASLVLGGTWARPDARFRRLFEFRARVLREMGVDAYEDLGLTLTLPAGLPQDATPRPASRHTPPDVVLARIDALLAHDAGDRLRLIRAPTLVIAADDDVLVPRPLSEVIASEIAGSRRHAFARGGHHFPQTQAAAYNELLREFFRAAHGIDNNNRTPD